MPQAVGKKRESGHGIHQRLRSQFIAALPGVGPGREWWGVGPGGWPLDPRVFTERRVLIVEFVGGFGGIVLQKFIHDLLASGHGRVEAVEGSEALPLVFVHVMEVVIDVDSRVTPCHRLLQTVQPNASTVLCRVMAIKAATGPNLTPAASPRPRP